MIVITNTTGRGVLTFANGDWYEGEYRGTVYACYFLNVCMLLLKHACTLIRWSIRGLREDPLLCHRCNLRRPVEEQPASRKGSPHLFEQICI